MPKKSRTAKNGRKPDPAGLILLHQSLLDGEQVLHDRAGQMYLRLARREILDNSGRWRRVSFKEFYRDFGDDSPVFRVTMRLVRCTPLQALDWVLQERAPDFFEFWKGRRGGKS